MKRTILQLVREEVNASLERARSIPILAYLGVWLGSIESADTWKPKKGLRSYQGISEAAAAYAAIGSSEARASFLDGLEWLKQREYFGARVPAGLEADPIALLALAAGLRREEAVGSQCSWLEEIVRKALESETHCNRSSILRASLQVVGASNVEEPSALMQAALALAVRTGGSATLKGDALAEILSFDEIEPEWAIFVAAAIKRVCVMEAAVDIALPTIEQVVSLLEQVPAALKRWPWESKAKTRRQEVTPQRWDVQTEYHVQSLLWAILRPVFPGLEDEENLPSFGHKHPRADLLVPSLQLVVEVKFLREATQSARAKVIEEIAADCSLYLARDSAYNRLIAFIWDNARSTNHHHELRAGIKRLDGVEDAIIVSRPGEWT